MGALADTQFLAQLVHRGHLPREEAERLLPALHEGAELDRLLMDRLGWTGDHVAKLRRTRAGEIPEIPGYEILGVLGSGGTSTVFRARDRKSGRIQALKVLDAKSTRHDATRSAFVAEARLLAELDHPGLIKGYGVAKSGSTYFSRLECIEGSTLLELLDRGQSFSEPVALRVILSVAEVLAYLAEKEVIHRDVKPGNIMLDQNGKVKVIDLGFAAHKDAAPARDGSAVGTVAYLSPELARGGAAADMRSDIYSLGVTLFHLAVGRLPFESSKDSEVLRMQVMQSLSSPELKSRGFSPHLQYFVQKMMAKEAEVRYQSWSELVDDIRAQIEGRENLDFERGTGDATRRPSSAPAPRRRKF
jgi:serine/threonine-protein kinase